MRLIGKLAVLGLLAAGVAGCEDTYGRYGDDGYGRGYYTDRSGYDYGYDRDRDGYYGYDREYDSLGARPDWDWNGARVYCRGADDRFHPCGAR